MEGRESKIWEQNVELRDIVNESKEKGGKVGLRTRKKEEMVKTRWKEEKEKFGNRKQNYGTYYNYQGKALGN